MFSPNQSPDRTSTVSELIRGAGVTLLFLAAAWSVYAYISADLAMKGINQGNVDENDTYYIVASSQFIWSAMALVALGLFFILGAKQVSVCLLNRSARIRRE